jgi:hypothetical protein
MNEFLMNEPTIVTLDREDFANIIMLLQYNLPIYNNDKTGKRLELVIQEIIRQIS